MIDHSTDIAILFNHLTEFHSFSVVLSVFVLTQLIAITALVVTIIKRNREQKRTRNLIQRDPLTNIFNRAGFHNNIHRMLNNVNNKKISSFTIFLIDIDNFKKINDTKGHLDGDICLIQLSALLQEKICDQFRNECIVARLGGDEFVLLIEDVNPEKTTQIAEKVFRLLKTPFSLSHNVSLTLSISMGIASYPTDGQTVTELLRSADLALYHVKRRGKGEFRVHDKSMDEELNTLTEYEKMIEYFITTDDFSIEYQPIKDLDTDKIIGAEALFRGNVHDFPESTNHFRMFEIAEQNKTIIKLGNSIIHKSLESAKEFVRINPTFVISINVSVIQLEFYDDVDWLIQPIKHFGIPPQNVSIEITESVFMNNFSENVKKLKKIRNHGIKISLDDFGTGYSSMLYLQELPVDRIKIDKSFIDELLTSNKTREIIKAIILISKTLKMKSCAEGVETVEQLTVIRKLGCDQIQGFFESRSVPKQKLIFQLTSSKVKHQFVKSS